MIFGGSHEKTMTLNPPCQPHCKVAGWGCSEAVGHPVGDGRAIREPGFHSVGVYVVAEGKQFLRVIMVEILISFHLNSSFNDFEIWFLTRWGLFFLSLESPNRTTLHLCDTLKQRQPAAHERQEAVRFRRIAPYGAWTRQPERPHVQPPVPRKGLRILAKV